MKSVQSLFAHLVRFRVRVRLGVGERLRLGLETRSGLGFPVVVRARAVDEVVRRHLRGHGVLGRMSGAVAHPHAPG